MNASCLVCDAQNKSGAGARVVYEDAFWRVRHSSETNIAGYFVLESTRHFLDLSEATSEECTIYGVVLGRVMAAVRRVTNCERVYTFSLGEAVPHYHLHIIPRSEHFPRAYRGRGIMSYPVSPSLSPVLVDRVCERVRAHLLNPLHKPV